MNLSKSIDKLIPSFSHEMVVKLLNCGFTQEQIVQKTGCSIKDLDNVLKHKTRNLPLKSFERALNLYCKYCVLNQN